MAVKKIIDFNMMYISNNAIMFSAPYIIYLAPILTIAAVIAAVIIAKNSGSN